MKSFATRTRDALTRENEAQPGTRDSRRAELTGLALTCGTITLIGGGQVGLTMRTEHAGTGRWIVRLLRKEFGVRPGLRILRYSQLGGRVAFDIRLEGEEAGAVMRALDLSPMEQSIPKHCLKSRRSRDAFLRGAFLGSGTLTDPEKGYQMEFVLAGERMARSLLRFLQANYAARAGVTQRKSAAVVYCKDSESIIGILSSIGAHGAILELENVRIMKDARNRANRAANCDSGNITKMVGAAGRQIEAIERIEESIGLDALPDTLKEIAMERKRHADLSLEALGALLEPPVGKSGVYHRLSRIEAIAQSIASQEGDRQLAKSESCADGRKPV